MKRIGKLIWYGLITAALAFLLSSQSIVNSQQLITNNPVTEIVTSPRRLNITVKVTEPDDLKIAEGQEIERGEVVSDRLLRLIPKSGYRLLEW